MLFHLGMLFCVDGVSLLTNFSYQDCVFWRLVEISSTYLPKIQRNTAAALNKVVYLKLALDWFITCFQYYLTSDSSSCWDVRLLGFNSVNVPCKCSNLILLPGDIFCKYPDRSLKFLNFNP